jgi:hypothetical protein
MALIIEDGSIVAGANSFVTDAEFVAYAAARAVDIPATDAEREPLLILAVDYLFKKEEKMQGCRVSVEQMLMFPRSGVCLFGFNVDSDAIPDNLKNAQMEAALYENVAELLINDQGQNISREKLDVMEIAYFSGGSTPSDNYQKVDAYLEPLLKKNSGQLVRI